MRLACAVVFVAGCYAPVPATGVPCASNGDCPAPLMCDQARAEPTCEKTLSDPAIDAAFDGALPIDGSIDASMIDAGLAPCVDDDFNDGNATGWTIIDPQWVATANAGPDNSVALRATHQVGDQIITHPGMYGVTMAHLALDFRIDDGVSGDFDIYLVPPGWTDPNGASTARHFVAIYVAGGDSGPDDRIVKIVPPSAGVELGTHPITVAASTWHHFEMLYLPNGSIRIDLDGSLYMSSAAGSALPGPLDLLIRFWSQGAIDNVHLSCVH